MYNVVVVDAELFDGDNNIVRNIIIKLFDVIHSKINIIDVNKKREILSLFDTIYLDLDFITKYGKNKKFTKSWSQEPLECLSGMSSATNLKDHIIKLKVLLDNVIGETQLEITNCNMTNENNIMYINKYIKSVFKYNIV